MMIYYAKPRFRVNEVRIENGDIIVKHLDEVKNVENVDLKEFYTGSSDKNTYVSDLLDIDSGGYCPSYLKNIIKSLRVKDVNPKIENVYIEFNEMIKEKWWLYLSLYKENELVDIILKFGKDVWNIVESGKNEIFTPLLSGKCSYDNFMNILLKSNKKTLSKKINKLILKIGVPTFKYIGKDNNIYSNMWNEFLYISMLFYLVEALSKKKIIADDIINIDNDKIVDREVYLKDCVILAFLSEVFKQANYSNEVSILKTKTDSKEVCVVYSILPFVFNYIKENYDMYAEQREFWKADILVDKLEDYREYLLARTKNEKRKKDINSYSYTTLHERYRRKIMDY